MLVRLNVDNRSFYGSTVLVGRVYSSGDIAGPVRVFAVREGGAKVVEHDVFLHEAGGYELIVRDGRYLVGAFEDRDGDGRPGTGEPAGMYPGVINVQRSGLAFALDVRLEADRAAVVANLLPDGWRSRQTQSTQVGARADLATQAFSPDAGRSAYWTPLQSFKATGGNLYAVEAIDPGRVPVVLIHGSHGSARDWGLFAERLVARGYEPLLFQYPSGAPLDSIADLLYWKLTNLRARYGYGEIHIIAHSMGGLLARRLLADHAVELPEIRSLTTLATPWGGVHAASTGVALSPAVVPSWRDLDPDGRFIGTLFVRPIPRSVRQLLVYAQGTSPSGRATDGTVTLDSQLKPEAVAEAERVQGVRVDHAGVLTSEQVFETVRAWLVETHGSHEGTVALELRYAGEPAASSAATLVLVLTNEATGTSSPTVRTLSPASDGRAVARGIAEGAYEARLVAPGFKSSPERFELSVGAGQVTSITATLEPQGTLIGRIVASGADSVTQPAGSHASIEPPAEIVGLRLEGGGDVRYVVPRARGAADLLYAYAMGRDAATGSSFSFAGLRESDYRLTVELADGTAFDSAQHVASGPATANVAIRIPNERRLLRVGDQLPPGD